MGRLRHIRKDKYLIAVILFSVLAFLFKLFLLSKRSLYIDPDEGYYLLLARNLLSGDGFAFNGLPNIVVPPFLPFCISMFYPIFRDPQISLALITALSGSALGILIYVIAKKKLSRPMSLIASILVLFIYQMNAFLPLAEPYVKTLYRGSDILGCTLIFSGLYFTILLIEKNRSSLAVLAGIFYAFSYLTRPEGFILFVLIVFCVLSLKISSFIVTSGKNLIILFLMFAVLASPYLFYLKKVTGEWSISGKVGAAQNYRISLLDVIKNENWATFRAYHYSLNTETMEMNDTYFGYSNKARRVRGGNSILLFKTIVENLKMYAVIPRIVIPLYISVFALIGLGYGTINILKKKDFTSLILFMLLPYSLTVAGLSYPIPRHHLFLVPLACLYSIYGIELLLSHFFPTEGIRKKTYTTILFSLIALISIYDQIISFSKNQMNVPSFKASLAVEKEIGTFLKKREAKIVMSQYPNVAVRAFSDWQVMPSASLYQIIQFGAHKKVDYIVLRPEKGVFYWIIDMNKSSLSEKDNKTIKTTVIEEKPKFQIIKIEYH